MSETNGAAHSNGDGVHDRTSNDALNAVLKIALHLNSEYLGNNEHAGGDIPPKTVESAAEIIDELRHTQKEWEAQQKHIDATENPEEKTMLEEQLEARKTSDRQSIKSALRTIIDAFHYDVNLIEEAFGIDMEREKVVGVNGGQERGDFRNRVASRNGAGLPPHG